MTYKYRVTLTGLKGFFRLYEVESQATLYMLHKQMRSDMEFAQDQLIMFKGLDAGGNVVARYGLFDLGAGAVDKVTMEDTVKAGITSFVYFYDVADKKSVDITFEGEAEGSRISGVSLVDIKGPNPIEFENGYVAYEDLPDDQRHVRVPAPDMGEGEGKGLSKLAAAIFGKGEDDEDLEDEDLDVDDDDEDDDDEDDGDEDGKEVFDGTEDLTL